MTARMYIWPRYALEVDGRVARFTDLEGAVVARLYRSLGCFVRTDDLIKAAYGDAPDGGPLAINNSIAQLVRRACGRIEPIGATITGAQGFCARRLVIGKSGPAIAFHITELWQMPPPATAIRGAWRFVSEADWRDHHVQ